MENTTKQQVKALFLRYGAACRILAERECEDHEVYNEEDRAGYEKDLKTARAEKEELERVIDTFCRELPYPDEEDKLSIPLPRYELNGCTFQEGDLERCGKCEDLLTRQRVRGCGFEINQA